MKFTSKYLDLMNLELKLLTFKNLELGVNYHTIRHETESTAAIGSILCFFF